MEDNKPYIISHYEYTDSTKNSKPVSNSDINDHKIYIKHHMLIEQHSSNEIFKKLNIIERNISSMSYSAYVHAMLEIPYCRDEISKILDEASLYNFNTSDDIPIIFSLIRTVFVMPDKKKEYFFNPKNKSLGVVIYGDGTLKLFFSRKNIGNFLYAKTGEDGGMITSSGIFNITRYVNNSHNIKKLFGFIK